MAGSTAGERVRELRVEQMTGHGIHAARIADNFRKAMAAKGAAAASWFQDGLGHSSRFEQLMEPGDRGLGLGTEVGCELHCTSSLALGMVDRPLGNIAPKHLLEAQCLGAELDVVVIPASLSALLVFHRERSLNEGLAAWTTSWGPMKLDQISAAVEAQPPRGDPQPTFRTHAPAALESWPVRPLVQDVAPARVLVVNVQPVQMPQRRATFTIEQGVQG